VSFTSAPAVAAVLMRAGEMGIEDRVLGALRTNVHAMCVGPVTARPLVRLGVPTSAPERMRLGALARHITDELPTLQSRTMTVAGHRLEIRGTEVRDGAHTPDAVEWLLERLPEPHDYVVVASILADKDAAGILDRLTRAGRTFVATESTNPRALPADVVAGLARPFFPSVHTAPGPTAALALARELGERVLVTGSLYLLADLAGDD